MTEITLHGDMGRVLGRAKWNLAIKSPNEAIHAINVLTKGKLYKYLYEKERGMGQYQILINNNPFYSTKPLDDIKNIEEIKNCELLVNSKNIKTIDIVPILSGAKGALGDILGIILGIALIVAGFFTFGSSAIIGAALIAGGIGLIAAGIINLLSSPPKFQDFREIDGVAGRNSYLFSGPENTTREGGPVPLLYGQLLVGSQVISASYVVDYITAGNEPLIFANGTTYDPRGQIETPQDPTQRMNFQGRILVNVDYFYREAALPSQTRHIAAGFYNSVYVDNNTSKYVMAATDDNFRLFINIGALPPTKTKVENFVSYAENNNQAGPYFTYFFPLPGAAFSKLPYSKRFYDINDVLKQAVGNTKNVSLELFYPCAFYTPDFNASEDKTNAFICALLVDKYNGVHDFRYYLIKNNFTLSVNDIPKNLSSTYHPVKKK